MLHLYLIPQRDSFAPMLHLRRWWWGEKKENVDFIREERGKKRSSVKTVLKSLLEEECDDEETLSQILDTVVIVKLRNFLGSGKTVNQLFSEKTRLRIARFGLQLLLQLLCSLYKLYLSKWRNPPIMLWLTHEARSTSWKLMSQSNWDLSRSQTLKFRQLILPMAPPNLETSRWFSPKSLIAIVVNAWNLLCTFSQTRNIFS